MAKVVVVGSCNLDLVIKLPRLPSPGETVTGGAFSIHFGGKGANQAAAARLAGAQVEFVGKVGQASLGLTPVDNLRRLGVGLSCLAEDTDAPSGTAFILVGEGGQNLIGVAPGANARLWPSDLEGIERLLEDARILLVQLEIPLETVQYVLTLARQARVTTILDPAPVRPLPEELFPLVDIITPNETEAAALAHRPVKSLEDAIGAARTLLKRGVSAALVTLGSNGALLATHDYQLHVKGIPVAAVDTTAAGDAFNGALAAALARGLPLEEAAAFANRAAALSTTRMGAQDSLPAKEQIDTFRKGKLASP